jgi:hypothetical protein
MMNLEITQKTPPPLPSTVPPKLQTSNTKIKIISDEDLHSKFRNNSYDTTETLL